MTDLEDDGTNGNVDVELVLSVVSEDRVTGNGEDVILDIASGLGGRDKSRLVLEEQRVGCDLGQLWPGDVFERGADQQGRLLGTWCRQLWKLGSFAG